MADLSIRFVSPGIRDSSPVVQAEMNLGSVVQALRCNSCSTLLHVRHGSNWFFQTRCWVPDEKEEPDVMNQVVRFEYQNGFDTILGFDIDVEEGSRVEFEPVWDSGNLVSISLLEAMRTNKTVRSLNLLIDCLEEPHLTAIENSLKENDTLQRLSVQADYAPEAFGGCSFQAGSEAFRRMLERNMCLRDLDIGPFEGEFIRTHEGEFSVEGGSPELREWFVRWQHTPGALVTWAIERNRRAFIVATRLGQVCKSSMHCFPQLEDVAFRRQLLLFFLEEGCQPPPQMFHILKGLPKH